MIIYISIPLHSTPTLVTKISELISKYFGGSSKYITVGDILQPRSFPTKSQSHLFRPQNLLPTGTVGLR
jgi:hypothetical protein